MIDPTKTTLIQTRDAIAARQISARATVDAYFDRIDRLNPKLTAYHETYRQRAQQRATEVDTGKITGPLAGVPIAIKDNMCTDYGRTTCSSKILENFHAPYTATAVQRLENAGAIVLGKTILDEFAMGSSTENSAFGPSRNPWNTACVPGGSSGGSAAALAADLCAGSLGSDTGGSIRQPAALCGVVGVKPTYGRVSRYGLVAFASSLDQIGPFAHTVADAALLLQILSGHDPLDSTSADVSVPDYSAALAVPMERGIRIGLAKQYLSDSNHPALTKAIETAVAAYKQAGAQIVEVDLPHTEYGIPTYYIVATAEASSNLARYDGIRYGHRSSQASDLADLYSRSRAEGFGPEVKRRIMLGTYALSSGYYDAYYLRALKVRRLIKRDFDRAFENCDAILCPTTTGPAFKFGEKTDNPLEMYLNDVYTVNANLAGIPGISIPGGFAETDGGRMPLGLQLLGNVFDEARLFRIAQFLEKSLDLAKERPTL
ncbi:MAG: Asp-tRNA(Asn)/Glu-tRNA(Gln) amidotransferase subunit GatA [Phycisphaeraceae bacterium]|nr:Asp-tRNA(Asn)/Glu-tRNA(Gln) amidotransferase subunit GatA [Phycisphaeraceae bacterium]